MERYKYCDNTDPHPAHALAAPDVCPGVREDQVLRLLAIAVADAERILQNLYEHKRVRAEMVRNPPPSGR